MGFLNVFFKPQMIDVKRVWTVHEALSEVNMANESSENLKNLLKQCTYNVAFLKCPEVMH